MWVNSRKVRILLHILFPCFGHINKWTLKNGLLASYVVCLIISPVVPLCSGFRKFDDYLSSSVSSTLQAWDVCHSPVWRLRWNSVCLVYFALLYEADKLFFCEKVCWINLQWHCLVMFWVELCGFFFSSRFCFVFARGFHLCFPSPKFTLKTSASAALQTKVNDCYFKYSV